MSITPITKKREVYSDFYMDLFQSPVNDDLARKLNEESVKQSIKNLILTDKGERLFQPHLGSDIRKSLFDNITQSALLDIKEQVTDVIQNYEPRATVIEIKVTSIPDENAVTVSISFYVINIETPVNLDVTLTRVR